MNKELQKTVVETITERYNEIFQAEKKAADFILKNPKIAVNFNVSELANYSGVSDATVIRLCKHLGYKGYYQMKMCLSRDIGRQQESLKPIEPADTSMSAVFKRLAETVLASGAALDEKVFKRCIQLLKECSELHLVATGNTTPLCTYYGPRIERLGIRCTYSIIPEHYLNHIYLADKNSVVLAISGSGTSINVVRALELARERQLKIMAITGYRYSPISKISDYLLLSGSGNSSNLNSMQISRLNEMMVLEVLVQTLENELADRNEGFTEPELILSETKY